MANSTLGRLRKDPTSYWWGVPRDILTSIFPYLRPVDGASVLLSNRGPHDFSLNQPIASLPRASFPSLLRFLCGQTRLNQLSAPLLRQLSQYITPLPQRRGLSLSKRYYTSHQVELRCRVDFDRSGHLLMWCFTGSNFNYGYSLFRVSLTTGTQENISPDTLYLPLEEAGESSRLFPLANQRPGPPPIISPDYQSTNPLPFIYPLGINISYHSMTTIGSYTQYQDRQGHLLVIRNDLAPHHTISLFRIPQVELGLSCHLPSVLSGREPLLVSHNGLFTCEDPVTFDLFILTGVAVYRVRNQQVEKILSTKKMGAIITAAIDLEGRLITVHRKFITRLSNTQIVISIYE